MWILIIILVIALSYIVLKLVKKRILFKIKQFCDNVVIDIDDEKYSTRIDKGIKYFINKDGLTGEEKTIEVNDTHVYYNRFNYHYAPKKQSIGGWLSYQKTLLKHIEKCFFYYQEMVDITVNIISDNIYFEIILQNNEKLSILFSFKYRKEAQEFFQLVKYSILKTKRERFIQEEESLKQKILSFVNRRKNERKIENWEKDNCLQRQICGHNVSFYEKQHKYIVDGVEVPSITDIVGLLAIYYGWDKYEHINQTSLESAAKKGTTLHKEIENYERFATVSNTTEFNNYLNAKNTYGFTVLQNEEIVILMIKEKPVAIGRFDMIVEVGGKYALMEIKRTSKYYREKVSLQLNLYRLAYLQTYKNFDIQELKILRLYNNIIQFKDVKIDEEMALREIEKYHEICSKFVNKNM